MMVVKFYIIQPPSQDYCLWHCFSKFHIQAPREKIHLEFDNLRPNFKENIDDAEQDQVLPLQVENYYIKE